MIELNKEAKKFRVINNITLQEVADIAGVTKQGVSKTELKGDKSPRIYGAYIKLGFIDYLATMLIGVHEDILLRYQLESHENEEDFNIWIKYGTQLLNDVENGYFNNCVPRI